MNELTLMSDILSNVFTLIVMYVFFNVVGGLFVEYSPKKEGFEE